ncbi:MAG: arylsulfotransferase family protein [Cyanobacteria bacterium P01_G01_bin.19]
MAASKFSLILFLLSSAFIVFNGGYLAREFKLFPFGLYQEAAKGWSQLRQQQAEELPWFYIRTNRSPEDVVRSDRAQPGLTLVTEIASDRQISAKVIDLDGNTVHRWDIDWFELWSDADHLPESLVPQSPPGTNIHGAAIMDNGDLMFNFESKGLIRLNRDGEVVWRLPYLTHHSVHVHDDGNLWVSGTKYQTKKVDRLSHLVPPFYEETILEISPAGKILREWYVADILRNNGYTGLLYMGSLNNENTAIRGDNRLLGNTDLMHLNDVEPFSEELESGFFQPGDVLISLRNINAVLVFNVETEKIKHLSIGEVVRQHDPDFMDGDRFSVFDNNNQAGKPQRQSRIVVMSATEDTDEVYFAGSPDNPFFTRVMGKSQWLDNGNLLITESMSGRGLEVDPQGKVVWEYLNFVDDSIVGVVSEVQRLPLDYTELFTKAE